VAPSILTVQVDVDTTAHLLEFYGQVGAPRDGVDPVYTLAVPRFADVFAALGIRATFFVTGRELEEPPARALVRRLTAGGHEIANHSYSHPYGFSRLPCPVKHDEIVRTHRVIAETTGTPPVGFRAPGWDLDEATLQLLEQLGYVYDSSVFPSPFTRALRWCQPLFGRRQRSGYGPLALACAPRDPYHPRPTAPWRRRHTGSLWEIPLTVVSPLRLPFYSTLHLPAPDALFYASARWVRGNCSYTFHAVDLLGPDEVDERLHRHPAVRLAVADKMRRCRQFLERLLDQRVALTTRALVTQLDPRLCGRAKPVPSLP
jgi:hypothetical protein